MSVIAAILPLVASPGQLRSSRVVNSDSPWARSAECGILPSSPSPAVVVNYRRQMEAHPARQKLSTSNVRSI